MSDMLKSLQAVSADELLARRAEAIGTLGQQCKKNSAWNTLAQVLHPGVQHLMVSKLQHRGNMVLYTLVPDTENGTSHCAVFNPGQYISVRLKIGESILTRPYTLCSTPTQALQGYYVIAVDRVEGGLASDFIQDTWRQGTRVEVSEPAGDFCYQPLRDCSHVIAMAGGSGITPFVSMAGAIAEGTLDFTLNILYGSRTLDQAVFYEDLYSIADQCPKVSVNLILSEEDRPEFRHGFITTDMIATCSGEMLPCSVFVCGPRAMYKALEKPLADYPLPNRLIRREIDGETLDPRTLSDCPSAFPAKVSVIVKRKGQEISLVADPTLSLLRILENAGILVHSCCRSGVCGACRARLVSGNVYVPAAHDGRRKADERYGWIHLCSSWALSDVVVEL